MNFLYRNFLESKGCFYNGKDTKGLYNEEEAKDWYSQISKNMQKIKIKRPPNKIIEIQLPISDIECEEDKSLFDLIGDTKTEPRMAYVVNQILEEYYYGVDKCFHKRAAKKDIAGSEFGVLFAMREAIDGITRTSPIKIRASVEKETQKVSFVDWNIGQNIKGAVFPYMGKKYTTDLYGVYASKFRDAMFPDSDFGGFALQKWQRDFFIKRGRITVVMASRGSGKSQGSTGFTGTYLFKELNIKHEYGRPFLIIYGGLSKEANLQVVQYMLASAKKLTTNKNLLKWNAQDQTLTLYDGHNERKIKFVSQGQEGVGFRGLRPHLVILDECHDDQTEVLTGSGWKFFKDVLDSDTVATMNPETREIEYQNIKRRIERDHDGEMYVLNNSNSNFCVTPGHKMLTYSYLTGKPNLERIDSIKENNKFIPRTGYYKGQEIGNFKIDGVFKRKGIRNNDISSIKGDIYYPLMGWFLSEGSIGKSRGVPCCVNIHQSLVNGEKRGIIRDLLNMSGLKYSEYNDFFRISSKELAHHFYALGDGCLKKRIPRELYEGSIEQRKSLLNAFLLGDGYKTKGGVGKQGRGTNVYYTSCKGLSDDLQEMILSCGGYASVTVRGIKGKTKFIKDHYATSTCDGYVIRESNKPYVDNVQQTNLKFSGIGRSQYKGKVYCLEVEKYNTLCTRRGGKTIWSGNCARLDKEMFTVAAGTAEAQIILISTIDYTDRRNWFWGLYVEAQKKQKNYKDVYELIAELWIKYGMHKITTQEEYEKAVAKGVLTAMRDELWAERPIVGLKYTIDDIEYLSDVEKQRLIETSMMDGEDKCLAEYYSEYAESATVFNTEGLLESKLPPSFEMISLGFDEAEEHDNPAVVIAGVSGKMTYILHSEILNKDDYVKRYEKINELMRDFQRKTSRPILFGQDLTRTQQLGMRETTELVREPDYPVLYTPSQSNEVKRKRPFYMIGKRRLVTMVQEEYFKKGIVMFDGDLNIDGGLIEEISNFKYGNKGKIEGAKKKPDDQVNAMMVALFALRQGYIKDKFSVSDIAGHLSVDQRYDNVIMKRREQHNMTPDNIVSDILGDYR